MSLSKNEVENLIKYQVGALTGFVGIDNLSHVKPHGALYNKAVNDEDTALGIIEAIKSISSDLIHVVLAGSKWESLAQDQNVKIAKETYADREIMQDGTLCPRSIEGSVIEDSDLIVERTIRMVQKKEVKSFDGDVINVDFDSICLPPFAIIAYAFVKSFKVITPDPNDIESFSSNPSLILKLFAILRILFIPILLASLTVIKFLDFSIPVLIVVNP